ncbi:hypothetical protein [Wenyingzhuangia sp. IMCC45574]
MRNILILILLVSLRGTAQEIDSLMINFTNNKAILDSELYSQYDKSKEEEGVIYLENSVLGDTPLKNRIKLKDSSIDGEWLTKVSDLVKNNPKILYPYLNGDTHDLSVFILYAAIYKMDIGSVVIISPLDFIYDLLNNEERVQKILNKGKFKDKKSLIDYFWKPIKSEAVKVLKNKIEE